MTKSVLKYSNRRIPLLRKSVKLRWMYSIKQDMKQNKIRPEWTSHRESWFKIIQNVNPIPSKEWKGEKERKARKNCKVVQWCSM